MKKITKMVFVLFLLLISGYGYAQISPKFYGKPDDFKEMAKRTLVVELLEENKGVIEKLSKKEKTAKELQDYKSFITDYNRMIQDAVSKYWKYNATIEYKTGSEVSKLRDSKTTKYVILAYIELGDIDYEFFTRSELTVPALMYQRIENPRRKPDYKIYFPSSYARRDSKYLESDYKFALISIQENIKWIIKNDKILHFNDYTEKIAEPNCSKLKNLTLLIDKEYLYKSVSESEAKDAYGNKIEFVSSDKLDMSFVNGEEGKAVLFTIPYGIAKGSLGPLNTSRLVYFKVIVDCKSGEILWVHNPGRMGIGENIVSKLIKAEFKKMRECKM
ncbi:MAG: hypothetical protein ACOVP6_03075 [Lacibacter sp.]